MWQYWARRRRLAVKVCLYGHEEAVTCLAASPAYNLVVSGSRDGAVIVWDVERGSFVRQLLPPHVQLPPQPISALAIDDLTVSIYNRLLGQACVMENICCANYGHICLTIHGT